MDRAIKDCLKLRLYELRLSPNKELMVYTNDRNLNIKYDNPDYTVYSDQTGIFSVASDELFEFIENNNLNILIIAVFIGDSELESFSEQGGWVDPDPIEESESEPDLEPEPGEIREMEVLNARGEPETRHVRVPRTDQNINVETFDFNNNLENPNPPKMVPFNFKQKWNWDGTCSICMDSSEPQSWCKLNCRGGHIFHCNCIKQFTNTLRNSGVFGYQFNEGNFNKLCPLCGLEFTKLSEILYPPEMINNRFGKKKLLSELRYLESL